MPKKNVGYGAAMFVAVLLSLGMIMPARAFYLEVPAAFKELVQKFKLDGVRAQEGNDDSGSTAMMASPDSGVPLPQTENNFGEQPNFQPGQPPQGPGVMMGSGQEGNQDLNGVRKGADMMGGQLRNMQSFMERRERRGLAVPNETKGRLQKTNSMINDLLENPDSIKKLDINELDKNMSGLEEDREKMQQMDQVKRSLKSLSAPLKKFDKQIAKLQKQGITVPTDVTDNLNQLKAIAEKAGAATSVDDVGGLENVEELMSNLQDSEQQMEMLSRWPKTLKRVDKELATLNKKLKSSKSLTDKLAKKEIDVSGTYASFEDAVNKLKAVRDDAVAKVGEGKAEEAFQNIQEDFFGQLPDAYEFQNMIQAVSNVGRFQSGYKTTIANAERTIKKLQKQKIDATDLEDILSQAKIKGEEILAAVKEKNFDVNEVMTSLQDMENLKQDFQNRVEDLTGETEMMPWEQGPKQFEAPMMPKFGDMSVFKKKNMPQAEDSEAAQSATADMANIATSTAQ